MNYGLEVCTTFNFYHRSILIPGVIHSKNVIKQNILKTMDITQSIARYELQKVMLSQKCSW
jgi:hypothetical protein